MHMKLKRKAKYVQLIILPLLDKHGLSPMGEMSPSLLNRHGLSPIGESSPPLLNRHGLSPMGESSPPILKTWVISHGRKFSTIIK